MGKNSQMTNENNPSTAPYKTRVFILDFVQVTIYLVTLIEDHLLERATNRTSTRTFK